MNAEVLKNIPDGKEILQKTLELKIQIEQETDSLAKRLSELIPMDLALDNANATLVRQIDSRKYERVSANEYVVNEQGAASTSPVVKELLQSMPGNHSEDNDMEEWERQMTTLFEDNDDDDAMKTYMA